MASNVPIEKIRNIGISAHIDSGKTTLSERILFYTGKIHEIHEVRGKDGVGAIMDSMDLEREKGITIQSAATYAMWGEYNINLIDTPGHVDFTIEVERALRVLDGAILVLCSVSGVQSQSITVDRQMKRYKVPRIAFINKMDRSGANYDRVAAQLKEKLGHHAVKLQYPIGAEDRFQGLIDLLSMKAFYFDGENGENVREEAIPADMLDEAKLRRDEMIEGIANVDDELGEAFLMDPGAINEEQLRAAVRRATIALKMTPVMCGSAYKNKGVQLLLNAVCSYLPNPKEATNEALDQKNNEAKVILESDANKPFVGLAFKLEDGRYGQLTYMRIYQGKVSKGDFIFNQVNQKKVKVPRIVRMHASEMHDVSEATAGDIVALFGIECASGDTFTDGTVNYTMTSMFVPDAVISLAVTPKNRDKLTNFSKALNRFHKEDPTFRVHRDEESAQTIISGMGELHLEIYIERMKREYDCEVVAGKPQVAYRETISQKGEFAYTHKKQTGGSGQFARVCGYVEPLPSDAVQQYEFVDDIVGGSIPREFIPACDKGFTEAVKKGSLIGFPVVGLRVVINDGAFHAVDSSEMAFKTAAIMGFREGYAAAKPIILEPIMKVEVTAPEDFQGSVVGQLNQRRGTILETGTAEGYVTAVAEVPLNTMFGYSTDLRSATQGKGEFTMEFARYSPVPRNEAEALMAQYKEKQAAEQAARK
ncbi:elongation factor G [Corallococcus exiguus]|uniref:elongation factor G n=1 Tax=Corallococcus TaxID=83461 RepID=UPI000EA35A8B|nr:MULTISPECIES: elongation factor G [unclassified Corallococcus]NNC17483.1 elongation factor G [Corallococcus exiguus]NRD57706.1 elongation factor G [Corallococcus exiguus]NRD61290.1 elongation factor G [Corallococcus exiguus]RKG58734.1 elongation factor G [Corallococcus sp. AB011P]RKH17833.1 elongation factor G [Corallococcus sp. CA041A]